MPHIFEKTETLNYSWGMVTAANWIKYPNPITNHVLSVDILSREVDPETGVLRTERLLCCKQSAPAILRTLGLPIPEVAWFREVSELDPVSQEYTARTVNLTMRNLMIVKETCVYKALEGTNQSTNPPQQQLTQFIQTAEFHAQIGISSVRNLMEEAARNRFQMNAGKGLRALESVIVRLLDEAKEAVADVDG
ncbi:PRELI-like family-domain-containing protein [Chytriomyces cf. hyalinus JEL632]|nr:PRELI-like family-domain-containing protein [Chytriomyces cf. hyalinus JEL632]